MVFCQNNSAKGFALENVDFGGALRQARNRAGLSQAELAEKAGLDQRAISTWETRVREPGLFAAVRLAEALGVSVYDLLRPVGGEAPPRGRGRPPKAGAKGKRGK